MSAHSWFSTEHPSQTDGNGHGEASIPTPLPSANRSLYSLSSQCVGVRWLRRAASTATHANHARARSGCFVRIWYVCQGAAAMIPNTSAISSLVSFGWKRSDMLLTKIFRGRFHRTGASRFFSFRRRTPVQRTPFFPRRTSPS